MQERKYGEGRGRGEEGGREGKIEGRGLHKQESGSSEMAESERLNLSTDGDDVCGVPVSGPVRG